MLHGVWYSGFRDVHSSVGIQWTLQRVPFEKSPVPLAGCSLFPNSGTLEALESSARPGEIWWPEWLPGLPQKRWEDPPFFMGELNVTDHFQQRTVGHYKYNYWTSPCLMGKIHHYFYGQRGSKIAGKPLKNGENSVGSNLKLGIFWASGWSSQMGRFFRGFPPTQYNADWWGCAGDVHRNLTVPNRKPPNWDYPPIIKHGNGTSTIFWLFLSSTPPFVEDVPLPCLITRGYPCCNWVTTSRLMPWVCILSADRNVPAIVVPLPEVKAAKHAHTMTELDGNGW